MSDDDRPGIDLPLSENQQNELLDAYYRLAADDHHNVDWASACDFIHVEFRHFIETRSASESFSRRVMDAESFLAERVRGVVNRLALGSPTTKPNISAAKMVLAGQLNVDPLEKERQKAALEKVRRQAQRLSKVEPNEFDEALAALDSIEEVPRLKVGDTGT